MDIELSAPERATKPEPRRTLFQALRLLFSDQDADLVSHQLEETRWMLPVLAAFHFFATLSVYRLAFDYVATRYLLTWTMASFVGEALLILGYFALDHIMEQAGRAQSVLRFSPFAALYLCLIWGWAALVFARAAEGAVPAYIDLLALLTMSVGLLCTVRLPATALQFILTPVVIMVTRAMLSEDAFNWYGLLVAAMAVAAGVLVMLAISYSFQRRVLAEKTLRHDTEVMMMLLADSGGEAKDWFWETDSDGLLTYHSPKFAELVGYPDEDLTGEDFLKDFISINNPLMISKMLVHENLRDEPMTTRDNAGRMRHWQISAKPRFDSAGTFTGYRGLALDVTGIRKQTQDVVRTEDETKKNQEVKAQFLMQMAQELRNPVNAIVGFSEVLAGGRGGAMQRDYMATIRNSGRQMQGLVNDVLEASRLERGDVKLDEQTNDLTTLIDEAIKEAVPRASLTRVSLVARLYEDVEVTGDLPRIKSLVAALIARAVTAAPQGSAVQIEMMRGEAGDLMLAVRDKGAVVRPEDVARSLQPFASVGLGLAIARRVARLHGGDIALSPGKDGGMEARLVLPAARMGWHPVNGQLKVMNIAA